MPENVVSLKTMLLRHWQVVVRGFHTVDHVLRRGDRESPTAARGPGSDSGSANLSSSMGLLPLVQVLKIVFVCGPMYGAAMGAYAYVVGQRTLWEQLPQLIYSGIKVPLLIVMTVVIALPSFFVINTLLGLRDDFRESLRAIVSAQAGLTIILASLFPFALFSYVSFSPLSFSYSLAILVNAAMFALASISAQVLLRGYFQKLINRNPRHRWMVRMWVFVYAFVGIQAAYVLRPFVGNPQIPPTFLRRESFENAYVKIVELVLDVSQGLF